MSNTKPAKEYNVDVAAAICTLIHIMVLFQSFQRREGEVLSPDWADESNFLSFLRVPWVNSRPDKNAPDRVKSRINWVLA